MDEFKDLDLLGEDEEFDNLVYLTDEEGNEVEFEFLDLIDYEGSEYVVLLPTEEDGEEEVLILKLESTDEDETENYASVDDVDILNAVYDIFKERFKDEFNFV